RATRVTRPRPRLVLRAKLGALLGVRAAAVAIALLTAPGPAASAFRRFLAHRPRQQVGRTGEVVRRDRGAGGGLDQVLRDGQVDLVVLGVPAVVVIGAADLIPEEAGDPGLQERGVVAAPARHAAAHPSAGLHVDVKELLVHFGIEV